MNLEKYINKNELSPKDVVEMLQPEFPRFAKQHVSMVTKGTYGVTLAPKAVQILNAAHPKEEHRTRGNRVTVWMSDMTYALLLEKCESEGRTMQDVCEMGIYTYLKPEARTIEPHELNLKLQKELTITKKELNMCRNELCFRCGEYRNAHLGACDGCRWKE